MEAIPKSPLTLYLDREGLSQQDFAEKMTHIRGARLAACSVSRWVRGIVYPSMWSRQLVAVATRGEVAPQNWEEWWGRLEAGRGEG